VNPVLELHHVSKHFGDIRAVDDVSFSVERGEVVALVGPSGSGKSTLVRCIQQLEAIDGGSIFLDGELLGYRDHGDRLTPLRPREVARQRRAVGMVFQQFHLFPHRTALQNITEAPRRLGLWSREEAAEKAFELLDKFGLRDRSGNYPSELSGGQQQRVAIARALALSPTMLMLDEPTSALDPASVAGVVRVVRELADEGTTMLVVTHQIDFAQRVASRFIRMGEGRLVAQGPIAELEETEADRAAPAEVEA